MTILSADVIGKTVIEDGQPAASITPADFRLVVDSLAGIASPAPKTATYTAILDDRGTCIEMNSASATNFQIPTDASVPFDIGTKMEIYRMGTGSVTVVAVTPGTTTVRTATGTNTIRAQDSSVFIRKRAVDVWVLSGDLT